MSRRRVVVRVRDEASGLADLSVLFDDYRGHYGKPPDRIASRAWLGAGIGAGRLQAFLGYDDETPVGMAIAVPTPASLRLGHFWQLRDLYVDGAHRHGGVGRDLVAEVCAAAEAAGALRVSLTTETQNAAALALYASLGFEPVSGYVGMALELPGSPGRG